MSEIYHRYCLVLDQSLNRRQAINERPLGFLCRILIQTVAICQRLMQRFLKFKCHIFRSRNVYGTKCNHFCYRWKSLDQIHLLYPSKIPDITSSDADLDVIVRIFKRPASAALKNENNSSSIFHIKKSQVTLHMHVEIKVVSRNLPP